MTTWNFIGFSQLVAEITDMMAHPSNTNSTGISLHRTRGWGMTFQPSDIDTEDEIAVVYKEQVLEWTGDKELDAHATAEWIADNVAEWILDAQDRLDEHGLKNARLTRAEIEAHLA